MDTQKVRDQTNALITYAEQNSCVTLCDGKNFWNGIREFCVTCKGNREIDSWRHGDDGMSSPEHWDRLAWHFDRHIQTTVYLAMSSSVFRARRVQAQCAFMQMHWLDDLGALLNQKNLNELNRPPVDVDALLQLSYEDEHLVPLIGTRWVHYHDGPPYAAPPRSSADVPMPPAGSPVVRGELDTPPPRPEAPPVPKMPVAKAPPTAEQLQDFAAQQAAATSAASAQPRTETVGGRWGRHGKPPPMAQLVTQM
eukprot:15457029-Alexandrium_andersonii.AAC.1